MGTFTWRREGDDVQREVGHGSDGRCADWSEDRRNSCDNAGWNRNQREDVYRDGIKPLETALIANCASKAKPQANALAGACLFDRSNEITLGLMLPQKS